MANKRLAALSEKAAETRHFLGEVDHQDTARIRDLLLDLAETQAGIIALLEEDEERYESLRPFEERR